MTVAAEGIAPDTTAPEGAAPAGSADRLAALRQRLGAAAGVLGLDAETDADPTVAVSQLYGRLVEHVHAQRATDSLWLLMTALAGVLPQPDDVTAAVRARDLRRSGDFATWLLEAGYLAACAAGSPDLEMDVVDSGVVVDVDFAATHELHTGIQRVVRETLPRWHREHEFTLVAWTDPGGAMRHLLPHESDRILRWHEHATRVRADDAVAPRQRPRHRLVVPWRSWVVVPENPPPEHCPALAALSLYSGSRTALIGYDCIPAISPELIHPGLPDRFMRYLEAVKHAHRVAGISGAATREFEGFVDMLAAQGLPGPTVVECVLPVEMPPGEPVGSTGAPLVVCIGSFEPRKNQLAVLAAAEQLWREGLDFRLEFIGGSGMATEFDAMMARLVRAGRPVRRRTAISDELLWGTVRSARFTVFVSLHEGFGLPVAESLACGTPCLTSDTGSTREIADGGGALTVDPLDDLAIADQMRRLLTDDQLVTALRGEALRRPPRTWDDYAAELWDALLVSAPDAEPGR
jgi:glycosyltransferase involved in cell wall biosynthesis